MDWLSSPREHRPMTTYNADDAKAALRTVRQEMRDAANAANAAINDAMHAAFTLMQDAVSEQLGFEKADAAINLGGYAERIEAKKDAIQNLEAQLQTLLYGLERDIDGVQKIITRLNEQDGND